MKTEQIKMSPEQAKQITNILQKQGLASSQIKEILNGKYKEFQNSVDFTDIFGAYRNIQNVLRGLADDYSIEELPKYGVSSKEIEEFIEILKKCNLTIANAIAINQYSNGSNMILSIKRGTADKESIKNKIKKDMKSKLKIRGLSQEQIENLEYYIENLNFSKPVHEIYKMASQYMQEKNIPKICYSTICTTIKDINSLEHIDSTIANLEDGLTKSRLPQSIKLYRAINTKGKINPETFIGKSMSNDSYTSTSLLYDSSFAKYDDYDTIIEIYAPKGTQGTYINQLSDYEGVENEVLLNSNDIFIINAQKGVIDKNGREKQF